jgi:probable F420-dependent oxidoreductase
VKLGLFVPLTAPVATPDFVETLGREAERLGFDSLWVAEHIVLFDDHRSRYPYAPDGRFPASGEAGFLDPFGALAFLAGLTSRIRLGTGICLVPQRNPVYVAKEVATVDWLSRGRLDFGVGVGWLAEEFGAVAAPFAERGARCRSYLEVCKRLWCDPVSSHQDRYYALPPCRAYPKPVQAPHPPIHFGGESDAALERVAALGQGWYGFGLDPAGFADGVRRLDARLAAHGRRRSDVALSVSPYLRPTGEAELAAYADAGAGQVILTAFARDAESLRRRLGELAATLLPAAHRLS